MRVKNKFDNYHQQSKISQSKLPFMWLKIITKFPFLNEKIAIILKSPKRAKILDVGCGMCSFLKYIHKIRPDIELYGIDVSSDPINKIPSYIHFKKASGDKIPFEDNYFDVVICQHVLEHIINHEIIVREIKRVTKSMIILVTPNFKNMFLWNSMNFYSDHTHIKPFTKNGFKQLAKQKNLKIEYLKDERYINIPWIILLLAGPYFILKGLFLDWLANLIMKRAVTMICRK